MEKLVESLQENTENTSHIIETLNKIIVNSKAVTINNSKPFENLLRSENNDILKLSLQAIAELAKNENNRSRLTNELLMKFLIPKLDNSDANIRLQSCRALGNVCFENDDARQFVDKKGLELLINLIKSALDEKTFDYKLISISCGCLMNLLMNNEELQKVSIDFKSLDVMESILHFNLVDFENNEDCTTHALTIVNMIVEQMNDEWLSLSLCELIVDILRISMNPEISVLCLEILRMECENDELKLSLAKKGTCELVYESVEKHGNHVDDEESRSILKMACDLIVLILTGDQSMEYLYDNGNGKVYEQMIFWLNSEDTDLLSTGVLAIGNFARNDSHCIQMVENGLAKKLLGILKYYSSDNDMKVQHALLSTLRNLSIPTENKKKLLEENLVDTLLSMLNIDHSPVEFKLLGTLRMVVDGQEKTAIELIKRKDFIEKLVYWYENSDHLGVRGEAPRLLAWLIKNCHCSESYPLVLSVPNTVKCLVEMMSSMHAVMQNEAVLALSILSASALPVELKKDPNNKVLLSDQLIEAGIGDNIKSIIEKYSENMERPTVENLLALLTCLVKSKKVAEHLRDAKLGSMMAKLNSFNDTSLKGKIKAITEKISAVKQ